jgi:hypothetical protein
MAPDIPVPLVCAACGVDAVVQWRRRSAADPTHTDAVYACAVHAITLDLAAHVHQVGCTAPDPGRVPVCGCTPEPLPPPDPVPLNNPTTTLSTGWVVPTPTP